MLLIDLGCMQTKEEQRYSLQVNCLYIEVKFKVHSGLLNKPFCKRCLRLSDVPLCLKYRI